MPGRRQQQRYSPNRPRPASSITRTHNQDSRTLVEKYGRMAAPFFRIEINDKDNRTLFSSESQINDSGYDLEGLVIYEVEYDETDYQTSMIRLVMANPKMDLQDGLIFVEGNTVDLWMGYDGLEPDYMGRGFIVEISPSFQGTDIPRFHVTAYDISMFMMEEGKGDIVPEGTAWYERKRRTGSRPAQQNQQIYRCGTGDDATYTTNPSDRQTNQNQENRENQRSPNDANPTSDAPSASGSTANPNRTQNSTTNNRQHESSRMEWSLWKQPRRGRQNGKVWKGKSDSEIANAIFQSYGIIPYTEATSESGKTIRRVTVGSGDDTEIKTLGDTAIVDNPAEAQGISQEARQAAIAQHGTDIGVTTFADEEIFERDLTDNLHAVRTVRASNAGSNAGGSQGRCVPVDPQDVPTIREDRKVTQKNGTSDWEFLNELARKHGYIVFAFFEYESGKWIGYWGPDTNTPQQHKYTFRYAQGDETSLASVKPTISLREQKTEIDLQFVDPRSGKENLLRVSMDNVSPVYTQLRRNSATTNIDPIGDGPEVTLNIFGRRTSVIADRNFQSPEDARDWLVSFWIRHARDFCRVEGQTIIGLPEMRARQHHDIHGIGRLGGNFFITKTTHKMGAGHVYETRFSGFKNPQAQFRESDVETESNALGDLPPPSEDTTTLFSQ
jgi:hypothetical protein